MLGHSATFINAGVYAGWQSHRDGLIMPQI